MKFIGKVPTILLEISHKLRLKISLFVYCNKIELYLNKIDIFFLLFIAILIIYFVILFLQIIIKLTFI